MATTTYEDMEVHREYVRSHILELCEHFFPKGQKSGQGWRIGDVTGEEGGSLEIALAPHEKAGLWLDHATNNEKGDFFNLLQRHYREVYKEELSFSTILHLIYQAPETEATTPEPQKINWDFFVKQMDETAKKALAAYRGYSIPCIERMIAARIIGRKGNIWALPVQLNKDIVAAHLVDENKQWRYWPANLNIGVLPLTYGSISNADEIHTFESPWDMFALADLLKTHERPEAKIAFISTRGATNGKLIAKVLVQAKPETRIYNETNRQTANVQEKNGLPLSAKPLRQNSTDKS
jgi:hypothetical protein